MNERHDLRDEYLRTICSALTDYVARGLTLSIHSDNQDGQLRLTFTIDAPDTFHALVEGREVREVREAS